MDADIPKEVSAWVATAVDKERHEFNLNIGECSVKVVTHATNSTSLRHNLAANMNSSNSVCLYHASKHADMPGADSVLGKVFCMPVPSDGMHKRTQSQSPEAKQPNKKSRRQDPTK